VDKTGGPDTAQLSHSDHPVAAPPERSRRRFGLMSALVRFGLAVLVTGLAGYQAYSWVTSRPEAPQRMNRERSFTVNVVEPVYGTFSADITTFGQVLAARTLDLRAQVQGQIIEVSPNFIAGGQVDAGEMLVRIDPFSYDASVLEARAAIANAELSLGEAREAKALEERNIGTARASLSSAQTDLERAQSLLASGAATQQTVDTRALTVAEREQALNQREANIFTLDAQILRQQAAIAQARHQLEVAQRNRANTEIIAPFAGTVTASSVTVGGYVNANENLGSLYETAALDVSFMLSDRQYGELSTVGIAGRPITAIWNVAARPVEATGAITRTAAEVDPSTGGVTLYARLDADDANRLRPGRLFQSQLRASHMKTA
jgi:membrane fusion protein, multidrug efflux system